MELVQVPVQPVHADSSRAEGLRDLSDRRLEVAEDQRGLVGEAVQQPAQCVQLVAGRGGQMKLADVGQLFRGRFDLDPQGVALERALDRLDRVREGRREQHGLAFARQPAQDPRDVFAEPHVEHAVRFIEHHGPDRTRVERAPVQVIEQPSGRSDRDVDAAFQRFPLGTSGLTADQFDHGQPGVGPAVGHRINACSERSCMSMRCRIGRAKAAVLPLPVLD